MPKVKIISPNCYEYQCSCGTMINLEWDKRDPPPEKLIKCFECGKKESEEKNENL